MLKTGAKPETVIQTIETTEQLLSAAGKLVVSLSPLLTDIQYTTNLIARAGHCETIKEMGKEMLRQNQ